MLLPDGTMEEISNTRDLKKALYRAKPTSGNYEVVAFEKDENEQ